jgi:hypothetical protein
MTTGSASDSGPLAIAANSHSVAIAIPAPDTNAIEPVAISKAGRPPRSASHAVMATKPKIVTAAVVRI